MWKHHGLLVGLLLLEWMLHWLLLLPTHVHLGHLTRGEGTTSLRVRKNWVLVPRSWERWLWSILSILGIVISIVRIRLLGCVSEVIIRSLIELIVHRSAIVELSVLIRYPVSPEASSPSSTSATSTVWLVPTRRRCATFAPEIGRR